MSGKRIGNDHQLRRLGVGRREPDAGEAPAQRVGEEQHDQDAAEEQPEVGPDAEAHGEADGA